MNLRADRTCARLAACLLGALLLFNAAHAHAGPQGGWWWNPQEAGRGYFLELQGSRLFFAAYLYDASGRATWVVSNDPMPDPDLYQGRLAPSCNRRRSSAGRGCNSPTARRRPVHIAHLRRL